MHYFTKALLFASLILTCFSCNRSSGGSAPSQPPPPSSPPTVSYIQWVGSVNGPWVVDATNDAVRFRAKDQLLVIGETPISNMWVSGYTFCYNGKAIGVVAYLVSTTYSKITGLVDGSGYMIDIYQQGGEYYWDYTNVPAPFWQDGPMDTGAGIPFARQAADPLLAEMQGEGDLYAQGEIEHHGWPLPPDLGRSLRPGDSKWPATIRRAAH